MSKDVIRAAARSLLGILFVSLTALVAIELRLGNTLSLCSFMTLAFVILAIVDRQWTALAGIAAGTLELALVLPGPGFAVSNPEDALGMIMSLSSGLIVAWFARSQRAEVWRLCNELRQLANHERETEDRLKEIAHRLTNDFSMLVAASGIIARRSNSEETQSAMRELSGRIIVLDRIYHRLWTGEIGEDRIGLESYLHELCDDLRLARFGLQPITLQLEVDDIQLQFRDAALVGMITNELLSNAYKHAFPDQRSGLIIVRFQSLEPDMLVLEVIDDGVGFKNSVAQSTGLGHRLLTSLAAQLQGGISFSRQDSRTVVSVSFPVPA